MQEHEPRSTPGSPDLPPVGWREVLTREHLPRLLVLCLAIWLHAANTMLAATTLPEAVGDIGGVRLISWAFALYLMGSIVAATAVSAYVGSAGLRRTMLVSTVVYTLGCVICAAAPAMPVLLAGRTVQGLGGGALVALVFIAQDRFFPNRLVPRTVACLSVVWMAAALCGPLIGGGFATAGLWRFAFWSFALQGLVLAAALHPLLARAGSDPALPARANPGRAAGVRRRSDPGDLVRGRGRLGSSFRRVPAGGMHVPVVVCRARFRRLPPVAAASRPCDRSRPSGRLRHCDDVHTLPVHDVIHCVRPDPVDPAV